MEFFRDSKIEFMKYRKYFVVISAALVVVAIFAVFVHGKLNLGIDFVGGTQLTVRFTEQPEIDGLRSILTDAGIGDAQIQRFGAVEANEVLIKTGTVAGSEEGSGALVVAALDRALNEATGGFDLNERGRDALAELLVAEDPEGLDPANDEQARARYTRLAGAIVDSRQEKGIFSGWEEVRSIQGISGETAAMLEEKAKLGEFAVLGMENVGPQIGAELRRKGIWAVVASLIGMLVYIWFRFELRFGIGALVAVTHDVIVTLGLFALGDFEFNLTTIAAFLTLVGYSVNDTVVVFDRVRENLRRRRSKSLEEIMDQSINQTLSRTVLTSGTTLLTVGCLLFAGGEALRGFAFILFVGIVVGTYSSVYVASPFTLLWERFFGAEARTRRHEATA